MTSTFNLPITGFRTIAELQQSLLPHETPLISGLDMAAHYRAAYCASGDYFDFFPLSDGNLGVLIADVSGHGNAAAAIMAVAHGFAHRCEAPVHKPSAFLAYMNSQILSHHDPETGCFVTAFYAVINPVTHRLTYASAGHVPPWLIKAEGRLLVLNRVQRLPLGIDDGEDYPQHEMSFHVGDALVAVTDGVTEAVDVNGRVFGSDRMHLLLRKTAASSNETLVRILGAIDQFTGSAPQTDDRTVVVVRSTA